MHSRSKKINHIPNGFTSVTPYFLVDEADTFTRFLKEAFEAEVIDDHREEGSMVHGAFRIFGSVIEAGQSRGEYTARQMAIHLYVEDVDAVYDKAIAAGGKSLSAVADQPYGERSGAVEDPCGNQWYIATQQVDMYPSEG